MPRVRLLLLFIGLLISAGCATITELNPLSFFPKNNNNIVGLWRRRTEPSSGTFTIRFKNDNTFEVDFSGDGKRDIWGTYALLSNGMLKITDSEDCKETICRHAGFYTCRLTSNNLIITLYVDECAPRKYSLDTLWERQTTD